MSRKSVAIISHVAALLAAFGLLSVAGKLWGPVLLLGVPISVYCLIGKGCVCAYCIIRPVPKQYDMEPARMVAPSQIFTVKLPKFGTKKAEDTPADEQENEK